MSITLYYLKFSPPCRAVLATAQILGLQTNIKKMNLLKGEHKTVDFVKLNPAQTIPVLEDNGLLLTESRAMMTYLVDRYSPGHSLYPKDVQSRAKIDNILYFDASTLFPAMMRVLRPKIFFQQEPSQELIDNFNEKLSIFEKLLAEQKFITGEQPVLADISIATIYPLVMTHQESLLTPKSIDYFKRVEDAVPELRNLNWLRKDRQ